MAILFRQRRDDLRTGVLAVTFFRQYDGNDLTYAYTVRNHFVTSLGTAETVAANREKLLNDFYDYRVTAIDEGESDSIRAYIVPTQDDQPAANKLAGLLVQQGIDVGRATESFSACGQSYAAGSYVINTAQPAKRLIRTLLDADVPLESGFSPSRNGGVMSIYRTRFMM